MRCVACSQLLVWCVRHSLFSVVSRSVSDTSVHTCCRSLGWCLQSAAASRCIATASGLHRSRICSESCVTHLMIMCAHVCSVCCFQARCVGTSILYALSGPADHCALSITFTITIAHTFWKVRLFWAKKLATPSFNPMYPALPWVPSPMSPSNI